MASHSWKYCAVGNGSKHLWCHHRNIRNRATTWRRTCYSMDATNDWLIRHKVKFDLTVAGLCSSGRCLCLHKYTTVHTENLVWNPTWAKLKEGVSQSRPLRMASECHKINKTYFLSSEHTPFPWQFVLEVCTLSGALCYPFNRCCTRKKLRLKVLHLHRLSVTTQISYLLIINTKFQYGFVFGIVHLAAFVSAPIFAQCGHIIR